MENKYLIAKSCSQAIELSKINPDFSYISGGTDVMINKYQKNNTSKTLIDISEIKEIKFLKIDDNEVRIGSSTILSDLENNKELEGLFPTFIQSVKSVSSPLIRKSATLGGNLLCDNRCMYYNQSEWWREAVGNCLKCEGDICIASGGKRSCYAKMISDTAPVLISLNASVCIVNNEGEERVLLEDIYSGDGINPHNLSGETIIKEIIIPKNNLKVFFKKLRERKTLEFTSLTCAISWNEKNIRVALGGVDPKPIVLDFKKNTSTDEIITKSTKKCRIVKTDLYSREYRKEMIGVFIKEGLKEIF